MPNAAEGIRGIRTLPDQGASLTSAEEAWVTSESLDGVFIYNETPGGSINSSNTAFTIANAATAGTIQLYHNGMRLQSGAGNDFTVSGTAITMLFAPETFDVLIVDYRQAP